MLNKKEIDQYLESTQFLLDQLIKVSEAANVSEHTAMWYLIKACFYDSHALTRLNQVMGLLCDELATNCTLQSTSKSEGDV